MAMTLRKLIEKLGDDAETYMDVPLFVGLRGANGVTEICALPEEWPNRAAPEPATEHFEGRPGYLRLTGYSHKNFVNQRGANKAA